MDIKSKNNKVKEKNNKFNTGKINILVFGVLMLVATGICLSYAKIETLREKYKYNYYEDHFFLKDLYESTYVLYHKIEEKKENKEILPSEFLMNDNVLSLNNYNNSNGEKQRISNEINNIIDFWEKDLRNAFNNLEYFAIDKEKKVTESNTINEINYFSYSQEDKENIGQKFKELEDIYEFYIVIDFDDKGYFNIKNIKGADLRSVTEELMNLKSNLNYKVTEYMKPIKNTTFVYAIPKELKYGDRISLEKMDMERYSYFKASEIFINIAIISIVLFALIIPYNKLKEVIYFNKISKLPFEAIAFAMLLNIIVINFFKDDIIIKTINKELFPFLYEVGLNNFIINIIASIFNIVCWIFILLIIFILVILIKYIWNKGVKNYIKEQTLTYKFIKYLKNKLFNIDLKDKPNKTIIKFLLINLVLLIIMCSMWFFGIIIAFIYSIVLFRFIKKRWNDLGEKYNKLLSETKKIADGNLDINMDENFEIFNSFRDELQNIQKGFKKAVDEEVKSQKMKTELISNVSHDLKTPLTSIITYVDLLKDKNITEENRELYLDVLDRKSQRLQALIEDLFEVSKATSGNINLNIVDVDVVSLMKQTLLELHDKINSSSLVVKRNFKNEKIILPLDSQCIFRVFENLVINITKYAMPGSRVYIDILDKNENVEIVFKNMSATEINIKVNELTERFVRGDKSRNTEGSGLGLAIAKSFVELQGGTLNIAIDGDLFKVTLVLNKK